MNRLAILFTAIIFLCSASAFSQMTADSSGIELAKEVETIELNGFVLDFNTQAVLPYANIYVLHKNQGAITNERGQFSMDITDLEKNDTLRFQYIGYKTRKITIDQMDTISVVYLKEDIINLSETVIFGNTPDLKSIVKNVLIYKDSNYRKTTSKRQTFIREREIGIVKEFLLKYKKSTIDEIDRALIQQIQDRMPAYFTSYTDFLGDLYFTANRKDSVQIKIDPIRMVALKEEYLDDLNQMENLFESVFANTGEEEYWKVKSGVFGQKLDLEEEHEHAKETLTENKRKISSYGNTVRYHLSYSRFHDKDQWEFLHKTGKYKYTLAGGTRVNGEDIYIIDFEPDKSGMYIGRIYIARNTFALIRADYKYAPGKTGTDINMLGVGYTETQFSGSIYFEKKDDNYHLKYLSFKEGYDVSIDRSLALMKKRKRTFFDKKLKELKVGLDMALKIEESVEYLVLENTAVSPNQYADVKQDEYMDIIIVDQFDDELWQGFSLIEPTQQMKEYKKQKLN